MLAQLFRQLLHFKNPLRNIHDIVFVFNCQFLKKWKSLKKLKVLPSLASRKSLSWSFWTSFFLSLSESSSVFSIADFKEPTSLFIFSCWAVMFLKGDKKSHFKKKFFEAEKILNGRKTRKLLENRCMSFKVLFDAGEDLFDPARQRFDFSLRLAFLAVQLARHCRNAVL